MIYCSECGKAIEDDTKFCPECGKSVSATPNVISSPENTPPKTDTSPPKDNKTSKSKKGCLGCLGLIVVLLVIGAIFGNSNDNSKNSTQTSKQTQSQESQKQKTDEELYPYKCDVESVGKIRGTFASNVGVAIAKIQEVSSIDTSFNTTRAQGVFRVVYVVATNNQKDAVTMDANSFKLIDDQGREFSHSVPGDTALQMKGRETLFLEKINPGNTAGGYISFDVPKNANITKMQFKGGFSGKTGEVPFKIIMVQ